MGYDFTRFSSQSFERFAQALVTKTFGPGVQVYGDGPDGAREASFEGKLAFQTHGAIWDGYCIVQAKHKRKTDDSLDDAAWVERELKREFAKFLNPRRNLRKPDFYLLITNAHLTPATSRLTPDGRAIGAGGFEKIENYIKSRQKELGLRGWMIWHVDLLSSMLDTEAELRTRFSAWVTESDVLSAALAQLSRPAMDQVVPLSIKRDLKKDRDVRRKDAGQVTEKRIFVDDVFVDLPISADSMLFDIDDDDESDLSVDDEIDDDIDNDLNENEAGHELHESTDDEGLLDTASTKGAQTGVVANLLIRARDKLDPESIAKNCHENRPRPNRIVLLGGPGQGKSTVAQFLVQIFRASVVLASPSLAADETTEAAKAVLKRSVSEGLPIQCARRFPLYIDLPKFADAAKRSKDDGIRLSLLRFATEQLSKSTDYVLSPPDLRGWLGSYPWVVVLDGLDEVPATGNRADVINAISEFWDDAHEVNADVLVLVTTRPQGYGDDLPPRLWEHWHMANLSPGEAIRFAGRLADVLLSDGSRREEILGELKRASEDPATSPIMISPLQVSILYTLVETRGGVPADRWSLFQRHYQLLRDREAAKEGSAARLLRDYVTQIDQIHYDAGFLLHVRSETSGNADSFLSDAEFQGLVEAQLSAEGYDLSKVDSVSKQIATIATDRLVLLGSKTGGRIAFDVRSLQEFMAAARIMSSPEARIVDRLHKIAARTHWRHVFRIAASKAFALAELAHLRRQIVHVCDALDQGDVEDADRAVGSGAFLALDLLLDNVAVRLPELRRSLVVRALKVLDFGPKAPIVQLANFLDSDTKQSFELEVAPRISSGESPSGKAAWKLLLTISNTQPHFKEWADNCMFEGWPNDFDALLNIFASADTPPESSAVLKRLRSALVEEGYAAARSWKNKVSGRNDAHSSSSALADLLRLTSQPEGQIIGYRGEGGLRTGFRFSIVSISHPWQPLPTEASSNSKWIEAQVAFDFQREPNQASLSSAIRKLARVGHDSIPFTHLSWPLASTLAGMKNQDFDELAEAAEGGAFGDIEDWRNAENRWRLNGVTLDDIKSWSSGNFISNSIAVLGAPFPGLVPLDPRHRRDEGDDVVGVLLDAVASMPNSKFRRSMVGTLARVARGSSDSAKKRVLAWIVSNWKTVAPNLQSFQYSFSSFLFSLPQDILKGPEVLDLLESIGNESVSAGMFENRTKISISDILRAEPARRGLIQFLLPQRSTRIIDLSGLPSAVFTHAETDGASTKAAVTFFQLYAGNIGESDVRGAAADLVGGFVPARLLALVESLIVRANLPVELLTALVREITNKTRDANSEAHGDMRVILKRLLDRRRSNLDMSHIATELDLPTLALAATDAENLHKSG